MISSAFRSLVASRGMSTSRRLFSTTEAVPSNNNKSGATIFQRVVSFTVGAGLTALVTQYFIFEEIKEGNKLMLKKQKELEARLKKLEK